MLYTYYIYKLQVTYTHTTITNAANCFSRTAGVEMTDCRG